MRKKQTIQMAIHRSMMLIKKYSPVGLSCIASVGVVITAIAAVKATPKAVMLIHADSERRHDGDPHAYTKTEAIAVAWKCCFPGTCWRFLKVGAKKYINIVLKLF